MDLQAQVIRKLSGVIDPETGLSIVRMGLIQNLDVDERKGKVHLVVRPTSFLCPLALELVEGIKNAVKDVADVSNVRIEVEGYARARQLNQLLADNLGSQ